MKKSMSAGFGVVGIVLIASFLSACGSMSGSTLEQGTSRTVTGPNLGLVSTFALFGSSLGVSNQGNLTVITGDLGTTGASTLVTGFHNSIYSYAESTLNSGSVSGIIYTDIPQGTAASSAVAKATSIDAFATFKDLASRPNGVDPGKGQLGGLSLTPGVYKAAGGDFQITKSDLILDAQGNPDAVWIFQMSKTLTVGASEAPRNVILINRAQAKNVYWQVGGSAVINPAGGGIMIGTIVAGGGIVFSTPGNLNVARLNGRAIALSAPVTMVNTVIRSSGATVGPAGPIIAVTGSTAADVSPVLDGDGFLNVMNNGGHVSAYQSGSGTLNVVNNGGPIYAKNSGNGTMTITSTATGTVTVTNTGNGRVTVNATGAAPIGVIHTGDDDYTYP